MYNFRNYVRNSPRISFCSSTADSFIDILKKFSRVSSKNEQLWTPSEILLMVSSTIWISSEISLGIYSWNSLVIISRIRVGRNFVRNIPIRSIYQFPQGLLEDFFPANTYRIFLSDFLINSICNSFRNSPLLPSVVTPRIRTESTKKKLQKISVSALVYYAKPGTCVLRFKLRFK